MFRSLSGMVCVLTCCVGQLQADGRASEPSSIRVECHGQLRHGLVAVGGETTGTTIKFSGINWELRFKDEAGRAFAESHHKQPVSVIGSLRRVSGVEVPTRWIVDVERCGKRDPAKHKEGATVTLQGVLRRDTKPAAGGHTLLMEADGMTWPLDLNADAALAAKAEANVSRKVVVEGRFESPLPNPSAEKLLIRATKIHPSTQPDR